jgi:hypothetical protein
MSNELEITPHEISAFDTSQIAGVGGFRNNRVLVLKFAYRNKDTQLVYLDSNAVPKLVGVLKSLVPTTELEAIETYDLRIRPETGERWSWSPS